MLDRQDSAPSGIGDTRRSRKPGPQPVLHPVGHADRCSRQGIEPVEPRPRAADRGEGVTVDYRLLPRFEASYRRHEDARNGLPERWRSDPRPEVQLVNEIYVGLVARARANIEEISTPDPG